MRIWAISAPGRSALAWYAVVFPSLILNYAGQAALVASGAPTQDNIFYQLCPPQLLMPFIILATLATIIASQSIISGAFSMTKQAINLGWLPRLKITQTSKEGVGQIYVGTVNWILMVATIGLALTFKKSDNLASAYGIAVSATMLMTTLLLFIAMREIWGWSLAAAGAVAACFFVVDASFFLANMTKLAEGGYVPLIFAVIIYGLMYIWHRGMEAVSWRIDGVFDAVDRFLRRSAKEQCPPRARHRHLPDARTDRDAADHRLARPHQPQSSIGKSSPSPSSWNRGRISPSPSASGSKRSARLLAGHLALWLHAEAERAGPGESDPRAKIPESISPMSSITSAPKPWCRARTARPRCRAGRRRFSQPWTATQRISAISCNCRQSKSSKSAVRSRSDDQRETVWDDAGVSTEGEAAVRIALSM